MTFAEIVDLIRSEQGLGCEVPSFDPENGNEHARYLFLLEAPGPKALQTGLISVNNPDPTARNFQRQLKKAGIEKADIALWNVVPWYLGDEERRKIRGAKSADVRRGQKYVSLLISAMPKLQCIVLVGGAARKTHVFLSRNTTVRILSCHHPSLQSLNANLQAEEENVEIFRYMKGSAGSESD